MNLEDIKSTSTPRKRQKRVGRGPGSGRGKTAGRGTKGQKARTGVKPPLFEGNTMPFYRRIPKRGFSNARFKQEYVILNVESLNQFSEGQVITPEILYAAHLISRREKKTPHLKILGKGELKVRSLVVKAHQFSAAAEEKIKTAGGQVERLEKQSPQETKTSTTS